MINDLIQKRYSPRTFDSKPVSEKVLNELFIAASYAASSRNEQPWRFIYATKDQPAAYEKIFECLSEWNQRWAKLAPVLIVTIAKNYYDHKHYPNQHAWYDLGQAVAMLSIQATQNDLYLHQMGGFSPEIAIKNLSIPEGFEPVSIIALGHLGKIAYLDEEFQKIEDNLKKRNDLSSFLFNGSWE